MASIREILGSGTSLGFQVLPESMAKMSIMTPVSYTHLDVYKRQLAGYAVQLTKDEGLGTMLARGAGFVRRRCFGKKARYLPAKKAVSYTHLDVYKRQENEHLRPFVRLSKKERGKEQ